MGFISGVIPEYSILTKFPFMMEDGRKEGRKDRLGYLVSAVDFSPPQ